MSTGTGAFETIRTGQDRPDDRNTNNLPSGTGIVRPQQLGEGPSPGADSEARLCTPLDEDRPMHNRMLSPITTSYSSSRQMALGARLSRSYPSIHPVRPSYPVLPRGSVPSFFLPGVGLQLHPHAVFTNELLQEISRRLPLRLVLPHVEQASEEGCQRANTLPSPRAP